MISELDLMDTRSTLDTATTLEYTFFSSTHLKFTKEVLILGRKSQKVLKN